GGGGVRFGPAAPARRLAAMTSPRVLGRFVWISSPTPVPVRVLARRAGPRRRRPPAASPTRTAAWCPAAGAAARRSLPRGAPRGSHRPPFPGLGRPATALNDR